MPRLSDKTKPTMGCGENQAEKGGPHDGRVNSTGIKYAVRPGIQLDNQQQQMPSSPGGTKLTNSQPYGVNNSVPSNSRRANAIAQPQRPQQQMGQPQVRTARSLDELRANLHTTKPMTAPRIDHVVTQKQTTLTTPETTAAQCATILPAAGSRANQPQQQLQTMVTPPMLSGLNLHHARGHRPIMPRPSVITQPSRSLDALRATVNAAKPMTPPRIDRHPLVGHIVTTSVQGPRPYSVGSSPAPAAMQSMDYQQALIQTNDSMSNTPSHMCAQQQPTAAPNQRQSTSGQNPFIGHRLPYVVHDPRSVSNLVAQPVSKQQIHTINPRYYQLSNLNLVGHPISPKRSPVARRDQPPNMVSYPSNNQGQGIPVIIGNQQGSQKVIRPMMVQYRMPTQQEQQERQPRHQQPANQQMFSLIHSVQNSAVPEFKKPYPQEPRASAATRNCASLVVNRQSRPFVLPSNDSAAAMQTLNTPSPFKARQSRPLHPPPFRPPPQYDHTKRRHEDVTQSSRASQPPATQGSNGAAQYAQSFNATNENRQRMPSRLDVLRVSRDSHQRNSNPQSSRGLQPSATQRSTTTGQYGRTQRRHQDVPKSSRAPQPFSIQRSSIDSSQYSPVHNPTNEDRPRMPSRLDVLRVARGSQLNSNHDNRFCHHPKTVTVDVCTPTRQQNAIFVMPHSPALSQPRESQEKSTISLVTNPPSDTPSYRPGNSKSTGSFSSKPTADGTSTKIKTSPKQPHGEARRSQKSSGSNKSSGSSKSSSSNQRSKKSMDKDTSARHQDCLDASTSKESLTSKPSVSKSTTPDGKVTNTGDREQYAAKTGSSQGKECREIGHVSRSKESKASKVKHHQEISAGPPVLNAVEKGNIKDIPSASETEPPHDKDNMKTTQQVAPLFRKALQMLHAQRRILSKPGDVVPGPVPEVEEGRSTGGESARTDGRVTSHKKTTKNIPPKLSPAQLFPGVGKTKERSGKSKRHGKTKKRFASMSKTRRKSLEEAKGERSTKDVGSSEGAKKGGGGRSADDDNWIVHDEDDTDKTVHYHIRDDPETRHLKRITRASLPDQDKLLPYFFGLDTEIITLTTDDSSKHSKSGKTVKGKASKRRKLHKIKRKLKPDHEKRTKEDRSNSRKDGGDPSEKTESRIDGDPSEKTEPYKASIWSARPHRRKTRASLSAIAWEECRQVTIQQWCKQAEKDGLSHKCIDEVATDNKDVAIERRKGPPDFQELLVRTWKDVVVRSAQKMEGASDEVTLRKKHTGKSSGSRNAGLPVPKPPTPVKAATKKCRHRVRSTPKSSTTKASSAKHNGTPGNAETRTLPDGNENDKDRFDMFVTNIIENAEREHELGVASSADDVYQDWQSWERNLTSEENQQIAESNNETNMDHSNDTEVAGITRGIRWDKLPSQEQPQSHDESGRTLVHSERSAFECCGADNPDESIVLQPLDSEVDTHHVEEVTTVDGSPSSIRYRVQWNEDEDADTYYVIDNNRYEEEEVDVTWIGDIQTEVVEIEECQEDTQQLQLVDCGNYPQFVDDTHQQMVAYDDTTSRLHSEDGIYQQQFIENEVPLPQVDRQPQLTEDTTQPQLADLQPQLADNTRRPQSADDTRQPQLTNDTRQQQVSDDIRQPQLLDDNRQPQLADETRQAQLTDDTRQPQLADDIRHPQLADDIRHPQLEDDTGQLQIADDTWQPQLADDTPNGTRQTDDTTPQPLQIDEVIIRQP